MLSPSQTALPSLLPSGLISPRFRRRRAATADKPQAAADYGLNRSGPTPRPAPTAQKPRSPRSAPPSQVAPGPSFDPVPAVPIQHVTDAATPAPPLLGVRPPEAPRRLSTPAALPEIPSPAEIEFIESVERFSHTNWAREQRSEPGCDAAIRYILVGSPSVLPDYFLLHLASQAPPVVGSALFSRKRAPLHRRRRHSPTRAEVNASRPGLSRQA